jgi:predicted AlkP superfamily phosphohydrolase/phosphomutase
MSIKAPTGWEILSRSGKRVAAVNVPMSYPPSPVNGVMVSCFMTPNVGSDFTYPPNLRTQVLARGCSPIISGIASRFADSRGKDEYIENLRPLANSMRKRTEQALWIQDSFEADVSMYHYQETDVVQHFAHRYLEPGSADYDESVFQEIGRIFYAALDDAIGTVSRRRNEGTLLVLVSDHGFGGYDKVFNVNNFLLKAGMLGTKSGGGVRRGILAALRRLDVFNMRMLIPNRGRLSRMKDVAGIDLERTRFMSLGNGMNPSVGIYGLDDGDVGLNDLVGQLREVSDPKSGGRVVRRVFSRAELFQGEYLPLMPDIVIEAEPGYAISDIFHPSKPAVETSLSNLRRSGIHHSDGLFLLHGAGIRQGDGLRADITDIFPTVLGCLGVPVPQSMDGRVLTELFTAEAGLAAGMSAGGSAAGGDHREGAALNEEESRQLEDHLKSLGYL